MFSAWEAAYFVVRRLTTAEGGAHQVSGYSLWMPQ